MDQPGASPAVFRFGPYQADVRNRILRKHGLTLRVRAQSFEVLLALLEHPGEVVTRKELRRRLWPEGIFVDFDNSLNSVINRLRAVLGDSRVKPKLIETLPRLGYRFVGRLEPTGKEHLTLAVLPFENLNHDPEQDYFADGVSDALTNVLGNVSTVRVISRQSVLHLKRTQRTLPEIARRLKVDVIVEGSVLQASGRVRITAQLVQAAPERHLWARTYESEIGDVLTIQGEVALAIARAVEVVLTSAEMGRLSRPRPVDPDAHLAYLKARHYMQSWKRESFEKALEYFHLAVRIDPHHALAHAHMADCYTMAGHWECCPFREAHRRSKEAALKALALDQGLSTAHFALAWATWVYDWDLAACRAETLRALELNPSDERAHMLRAMFLITTGEDRTLSLIEARTAFDLDPLSLYMNANLACIYLFAEEYDRAVEQARKTIELYPDWVEAWRVLGLAEVCRCHFPEALAALSRAVAISADAISNAYLGWAQAKAGSPEWARGVIAELARSEQESVPPRCFVFLYGVLGEPERAFEWLEKAYRAHDSGLLWLNVLPIYAELRPDPRFREMVNRFRFPAEAVD